MEENNIYFKKYLKYKKKYTELKHQMMGGTETPAQRVARTRKEEADRSRGGPARQAAARQEDARQEDARQAAARQAAARQEDARQEDARQAAARQEDARQVEARQVEAAQREAVTKVSVERKRSEYNFIYESLTNYKHFLRPVLFRKWNSENKGTGIVNQFSRSIIGTKKLVRIQIKNCQTSPPVYDEIVKDNFSYTDNESGKRIEIKINVDRVRRVVFRLPINIKYIFADNSEEIKSTMIMYQIIFLKHQNIFNILEDSIDIKNKIPGCV